MSQVLSGGFIGCGILFLSFQAHIYIIDVYLLNVNSALAATSFGRAFMAAGFPLSATYMYEQLDVA